MSGTRVGFWYIVRWPKAEAAGGFGLVVLAHQTSWLRDFQALTNSRSVDTLTRHISSAMLAIVSLNWWYHLWWRMFITPSLPGLHRTLQWCCIRRIALYPHCQKCVKNMYASNTAKANMNEREQNKGDSTETTWSLPGQSRTKHVAKDNLYRWNGKVVSNITRGRQ